VTGEELGDADARSGAGTSTRSTAPADSSTATHSG
jgi:hypothetical protein